MKKTGGRKSRDTLLRGVFVSFRNILNLYRLDPDPELGKFKAGSGSEIDHSGSTTLDTCTNCVRNQI